MKIAVLKYYLILTCLFFACEGTFPRGVEAQTQTTPIDREFPIPHGFESRIAFWRFIFTKYGEDHRVFHHREQPAIIYSVLDFSEINAKIKGKANYRAREKAVDQELARIKKALKNLEKGRAPSNELETRIKQLFAKHLSATKKEFRHAQNQKILRYQRGIKERFRQGLVRSGRYLYAIENIFKTEGLPPGLARLPLVESSFDYEAYSSVGAAGIWQFMRSTGRLYLRIDASIDERRDPSLATRAAARYLSNAYQKLGTWPLAITSYNHGIVGVKRGVTKTGSRDLSQIVKKYKGKTFGFASSNFYAEFLAALEVERNAEFYFPGIVREQPWHFDEVRLGRSVRFSQLAKKTGVSKDELAKLNLSFKSPVTRDRVSVPRGSVIKLPRGKKKVLLAAIPNSKGIALAAPAAESKSDLKVRYSGSGQKYRVRPGDTIGSIARKFRVSQKALMANNGIRDPRRLRSGSTIKIPVHGKVASSRQVGSKSSRAKTHIVRSGDTLSGIAKRYGVRTAALKRSNSISNANNLRAGQKLSIPGASAGLLAKKKYIVKKGDTLSGIAKNHKLSLRQLKQLNPSASKLIKPGQSLRIN